MFSSLEPFKVVVDEHGDPALLKKELRNYRATIVVREETITELKEKVDKVTDRFREACRQQKNFEHLHVDAISAGISVGKKSYENALSHLEVDQKIALSIYIYYPSHPNIQDFCVPPPQ
ncbi:hypothetical protein P8452_70654 [Trifolium repens]|jgi:hypothetical protein|nr:hypothetical protein P8452_70654 [Trifolium repens]